MAFLRHLRISMSFDYRSMAFYRILMGLIIMSDMLYRLPDLVNFYTDLGLVPRKLFFDELGHNWSASIFFANGSTGFALLLFLIYFGSGFFIMLGRRTSLAFIVAFVLNVSLHNRNWTVNNGGDDVLRAILFFSIFLPLGKYFSVDAGLEKKDRPVQDDYFSFWVMTFFLQAFVIYFVSYILKHSPIWRSDFTAMYYSSRLDIFASDFGIWSRQFPLFQKLGTAFTAFLEWIGPIFLVMAWALGRHWWILRTLTVFLFFGLHFGIFLTMKIGLFPWICIVMWTIFLPGKFWDLLGNLLPYKKEKLQIYFDENCRFCEKSVYILRSLFLLPASIDAGQSNKKILGSMEKNHSWVIVASDGEFYKYEGFLKIAHHSPVLFWFLPVFKFWPIRKGGEALYHWVSHHREAMGKITQYLPFREERKPVITFQILKEGLGALTMIALLLWNLSTIKGLNVKTGYFGDYFRWLHLYQEWNMFAPYPKMDNIWVEVTGELSDGTSIDVLTGSREIFQVRDQSFYEWMPNEHWRKYFLNLSEKVDYARYLGGYLCRRWNNRGIRYVPGTTLRKMSIKSYSQMNYLEDVKGPIQEKVSWNHWCFDEDYAKDNAGAKR